MLLVGCSGSDDSDFTCAQTDRSGTYLAHYDEGANGTCGELPDELVRLDPNGAIGDTCAFDAPDSWSSDQCRLDRSITCCDNNVCTHVVATTTQQDESGAEISGILTMRAELGDGFGGIADSCASLYTMTATRQ